MQLLNYTSPKATVSTHSAISIADNKYLAVMHGQDLWLCLLAKPDEPFFLVKNVVEHSLQDNHLATIGIDGNVQVFDVIDTRPVSIARFKPTAVHGRRGSELLRILLSPSGRFLVLECKLFAVDESATIEASLYEVHTGYCSYSTTLHEGASRTAFATLPNGVEVLFVSASKFPGVQLIHCASGSLLHEYSPETMVDFCPTDYILTSSANRLVTFGCVRALPCEVRVYDFAPSQESDKQKVPLPIVYQQREVYDGHDTVLPPSGSSIQGDTCICLTLITGVPDESSIHKLLPALNATDTEILSELIVRKISRALLTRFVDLDSGAVHNWTLAEINATKETHVHLLNDSRAVCINERVQLVDLRTGEVEDYGPSGAPGDHFISDASSDARTVALFAVEHAHD